MGKIFVVVEVPEEKKIKVFYPAGEANIWRSIIKDKFQGPKFTWANFIEELSSKFYPITVQ